MIKNKASIIKKIDKKLAVVGIIGLGYVGMPLSLSFVNTGFKVIGFDIDSKKVDQIKNKISHIWSISSKDLTNAMLKGFEPTVDISKISSVDIIIFCVPTPLTEYGQPELKYITNSVKSIVPYLKQGQLISIESTTYPGTTEEEVIPRLEKSGLVVGKDIFVCYSPEREDPGNESYSTRTIPKIVGAYSNDCLDIAVSIYSQAVNKVVPVSSIKVAEMTKLHENIYRLINIGLVNEMKMICDKMKINIHEVVKAAQTKPFGFTAYYPGPGVGGHCIPIDPHYLTWKAKQFSIDTKFITLAQTINEDMPKWILDKLLEELNLRGLILNNLNILFIGIAYKKNVDDIRESPSIKLMELFNHNKALIDYHDPYIKNFKFNFLKYKEKESVDLKAKNIASYDLVVIATDHDNIDYELIYQNAKLIIDTRGRYYSNDNKIINA